MTSILKRWRYADFILLATLLALLAYGLAMVYSSTFPNPNTEIITFSDFVKKQAIYAVMGFAIMLVLAFVDYRLFDATAYLLFVVAIFLLCILFVIGHGHAEWGSQRWINLGLFPLQPSEVAKPALVIALAKYFSDNQERIRSFRVFVISALIAAIPTGLVYMQPDLGSSGTFVVIWFLMALVAGVRLRFLGLTAGMAGAAAPIVWSLLKEYQRDRITIFLHPESDPWGQGYNIIQAQISVGSGGMFGRGFLAGTQSQGHFLRVQQSDFIFSVLAEEMGFLGAMALFALFMIMLFRLLRDAGLARDNFGRYVVAGIAVTLLFTIAVNVGANLKLLPVTGIPLPFISYGGSALITNLACLGIVQSVVMRRKRYIPA